MRDARLDRLETAASPKRSEKDRSRSLMLPTPSSSATPFSAGWQGQN
jgi:hypothetical protein